jgi:hypothetical protein
MLSPILFGMKDMSGGLLAEDGASPSILLYLS